MYPLVLLLLLLPISHLLRLLLYQQSTPSTVPNIFFPLGAK
jgi:hypothetical protein